jgi:hypothetical protein
MLEEIGVERLWPPDWETITAHNGWRDELLQHEAEGLPRAKSIEELIARTQHYQGEHVRYFIDHFRCHRFSRCNSFFQFHFADCWPAVTWSVLDYRRRPKASFQYLKESFAPVTVAPDCPPVFCLASERIEVPVYGVNDTPWPAAGYEAHASICDAAGETLARKTWRVDLPANSAVRLGVVRWRAPSTLAADRETTTLILTLADGQGTQVTSRRYRTFVCRSYSVPLADPVFERRDWSWFRIEEGTSQIEYAQQDGRTFARFRNSDRGLARVVNRVGVRTVAPGDWLRVSLAVRADANAQRGARVAVSFEATAPVEINPDGRLACLGAAGETCVLEVPAETGWHLLQGTLVVPPAEPGVELHLACQAAGAATVDITKVQLVRDRTGGAARAGRPGPR